LKTTMGERTQTNTFRPTNAFSGMNMRSRFMHGSNPPSVIIDWFFYSKWRKTLENHNGRTNQNQHFQTNQRVLWHEYAQQIHAWFESTFPHFE